MLKKSIFSGKLRQLGVLYYADWIRFYIQKSKNLNSNYAFKKKNPNVTLPPDYLLYESFQLDYEKYYTEGKIAAQWLANHLSKHTNLKGKKILDWGCGPGRIIRHLPTIVGNNCKLYGTDYNKESIAWCAKKLKKIKFNNNTLKADLPYPDNFFDVIYGISIFTHLSEKMHFEWSKELLRVLALGGILFLTMQGDNYKAKLSDDELEKFENGMLVIRGNVKEGHRTYSAFQPKAFTIKLFEKVEILEHIERPIKGNWYPQDIWILKK